MSTGMPAGIDAIVVASLTLACLAAGLVFHVAANHGRGGIGVLAVAVLAALAVFLGGYTLAWHLAQPSPIQQSQEAR